MLNDKIIQLTQDLQLSNGAHILYLYEDPALYLNNAIAYIRTGIEQEHHILLIESSSVFQNIRERLSYFLTKEDLHKVHYMNNEQFYSAYGDFYSKTIVEHFNSISNAYISNHIPLRTWSNVVWKAQDDIVRKLENHERNSDMALQDMRMIGVCAYNSAVLTASLQTMLMRNHEYLMTDTELVRSSLYSDSEGKVIFPSISIHSEMESERNFYKQKLDFAHVISHEVRNPLTVIKAYAYMISQTEPGLSAESRDKLRLIMDYVDLVDNEMTDIINTEQMLSNDALWNKEDVHLMPLLQEAVEFMGIKARLQNIQLTHTLDLTGDERIFCNPIGLRLILSNLINNSIKYSAEQTTICILASIENNHLIIHVEDQGIGMTEKQVAALFRKYGKLNQEQSGQGIGLYMVKTLLDHFNGKITIQSQPNIGTKVSLRLPIYTGEKTASTGYMDVRRN
ncbi:ATP-binding protein [Alicyclobacillus fodiniaquatilis]|uniref:histidine kinase n=1 Tax=Alicyclobacillus fodiniaquatilis TaxID=1661150 RepID=A0ABW4JB61_9BACL